MHRFPDVFFTLAVATALVSGVVSQALPSKWPILYPAPTATATLVLEKSSGSLFHAQGALAKFHCSSSGSQAPFASRDCASPLILMSANPLFQLSISAVDAQGHFTPLDSIPIVQTNTSLAKLDLTSLQQSSQHSADPYRAATVNFSVEVLQVGVPVAVNVSLGAERRDVVLYYDPEAPEMKRRQVQNVTAAPDGRFMTMLSFRDWIYLSVGTGCDPRLSNFLPERLNDYGQGVDLEGRPMQAPHISQAIEASSVCAREIAEERKLNPGQCTCLSSNLDPSSLRCKISMTHRALLISGRLKKSTRRNRKTVDLGERIEIGVAGASLMDGAGNQLGEEVSYSATVFRKKKKVMMEDSVGAMSSKTLMAASAVVAASSMAPPSHLSLAVEGASGFTSLVDLLSLGQKFYLIGFLVHGKLPENFRRVSKAYAWCALNIKLLWETQDPALEDEMMMAMEEQEVESETSKLELLGKGVAAAEAVEMFSYNNKINPYIALGRILFIAVALHGAILLARFLLFFVIKQLHYETPSFLIFPRIELFVAFWTLPAIAAACAKLITFSTRGFFLGLAVLVVMPGMFLCLLAIVLYFAFFSSTPDEWRVQMVTSEARVTDQPTTPDTIMALPPCGPITAEIKADGTKQQKGNKWIDSLLEHSFRLHVGRFLPGSRQGPHKKSSWLDLVHYLLTQSKLLGIKFWHVLFGRPVEKTKWVSRNSSDKFLPRFGPLFEDFRVHHRIPSSKTRSAKISSLERIPLATALLDCTKRILIAMVSVTELEASGYGQLMSAVLISSVFLLYLRFFHPYRSRWRLGLAMLVELTDCVTFIVGMAAVAEPNRHNHHTQAQCGLIMICTQAIAYLLMLCEKLVPALHRAWVTLSQSLKPGSC